METYQTVVAKINDGYYDAIYQEFDETLEPEYQWIQDLYKKIEEHKIRLKEKKKEFVANVKKREAKMEEAFRHDCLEAAGLLGHPKVNKAWAAAWDRGHASGRTDILLELMDIAGLLLD